MSSKRAIRRRSCVGKRKFETVEDADRARRRTRRLHHDIQEIYRCRFCGGYHLGHHSTDGKQDSKKVHGPMSGRKK